MMSKMEKIEKVDKSDKLKMMNKIYLEYEKSGKDKNRGIQLRKYDVDLSSFTFLT